MDGQLVSISTTTPTDLIDAKLEEHQLCASRQCPRCGHKLSKRDWGGLPAGVKFDPTDQELIEHLEAKVGGGGEGLQESNNKAAHPLIDKFIPTLDGEDGICYTHPEKLPGVTRDGLSRHFFHRPSKAYTTGTRKRRKIQIESDTIQGATVGETRWHKTGKTRPVMVNGRQKGCKKILVLYTNFGKNRKPEKTNWVMHQYHLGQHEEEKEGELVVSKIFYQTQPRQCNWSSSAEKSVSVSAAAVAASVGHGEGSGEASGSVSSKEVAPAATDELVVVGGGSMAYTHALEIHHQFKVDPFGFVSFSKGFDEAGIGGGARESCVLANPMPSMSAAMCDPGHHHEAPSHHLAEHDQHYQHHHQQHHMATASFHISRPTHPISQIILPPPLHQASIILDDHGSFHVPGIILSNENFQQQQQTQQETQQQQHHKIGGRSASGLEEIIRGCTSSSSADLKEVQESSMTNPQEAEWLKYSTFWHEPDSPNHHG